MSARNPRYRFVESAVLGIFFLAALVAPALVQLTHPAQTRDEAERRTLAELPQIPKKWRRIENWDKYPGRFEKYFNDHFGLREWLLVQDVRLQHFCFGRSPSSKVLEGRDGWLFWNGEQSTVDYRGLKRLSERQLMDIAAAMSARKAWLSARGIQYLVVVCADKQSVYPEFLPRQVTKLREGTLVDQLQTYLSQHGGPELLDLRAPLRNAKSLGQLYLKTDTHWTSLGGFAGYQALMERLHAMDARLVARPFPGFHTEQDKIMGDLRAAYRGTWAQEQMPFVRGLGRMGERTVEPAAKGDDPTNVKVIETTPPQSFTPLRLVVARDSFFEKMIQFVSPHFARATYLWPKRQSRKDEQALAELLEKEKPQIFIEEVVERFLDQRFPAAADVFGGADAADSPAAPAVAFPAEAP